MHDGVVADEGLGELRSVVASRLWRDGHVLDEGVNADELAAAVADENTLVWFDLVDPSPAELAELSDRLGLPPTVVEDALAPHERPKVSRHQDDLYFTVYATALGPPPTGENLGRLVATRISGIVTPTALVTVRLDDRFDMTPVLRRWDDFAGLTRYGSGALVHGLLDVVVDGHFDTIQAIDDEIEDLEDALFEQRTTGHDFLRRVYGVRKDLVALRRVVLPMREAVNALLRHKDDLAELSSYYDDLYDHVLRASEWTESLRDMVTSIFETNLSLQDARLNQVMKKLAAWAAIIAVPTAVTGWFGQNVPYPGFSEPFGFWLSVAAIVAFSTGLYAVFRRRDWL